GLAGCEEEMKAGQGIRTAPASAAGVPTERITINKVIVREKSPTVEQMKTASATIETSLGNLKIQFLSDAAPNTTRSFIRNARSGLYDGTTFFRISQKYFVEGGYLGDWPQDSPNRKRIFSLWQMPAEKSEAKQTRGVISMTKGQHQTTAWTS